MEETVLHRGEMPGGGEWKETAFAVTLSGEELLGVQPEPTEIERLRRENDRLRKRVAELEEEVESLGYEMQERVESLGFESDLGDV